MLDRERDIDNLDPVEELMIAYWAQTITELSIFTNYALAYLHQDGWALEAIPDAEHDQEQ